MWLTPHDECRAWKSLDWGATDRLRRKSFIADPANKATSVVLTDEGWAVFLRHGPEVWCGCTGPGQQIIGAGIETAGGNQAQNISEISLRIHPGCRRSWMRTILKLLW
jgi:hypothetical protein